MFKTFISISPNTVCYRKESEALGETIGFRSEVGKLPVSLEQFVTTENKEGLHQKN